MPIRMTKWDIAAALERHLEHLYSIRRNLIKTGGSTEEIEHSIHEIQSLIANLSDENPDVS